MGFLVLFFLFSPLFNIHTTEACGVKKLFVFGDSFVDTGNFMNNDGGWLDPYGMTFPGKPFGRFSNGRVLSDYIASFFDLNPPIAFNGRTSAKKSQLKQGMNFACGGSGVFNTYGPAFPNMTTQIDNFQLMLEEILYKKNDLRKSVTFVTVGVNDYVAKGDNALDLQAFTMSLINQLVVDAKRIHDLGARKVALTTIYPLGCAPSNTATYAHKKCNQTLNKIIKFYNKKLKIAVQKLNSEIKHSPLVIIDLNKAIMSILKQPAEKLKFNPLKPCCDGITSEHRCGALAKNGTKMYKICENPTLSLFWDFVHPSQNGWHLIYSVLKHSLYRLYR